jgi:hypothetical protein
LITFKKKEREGSLPKRWKANSPKPEIGRAQKELNLVADDSGDLLLWLHGPFSLALASLMVVIFHYKVNEA